MPKRAVFERSRQELSLDVSVGVHTLLVVEQSSLESQSRGCAKTPILPVFHKTAVRQFYLIQMCSFLGFVNDCISKCEALFIDYTHTHTCTQPRACLVRGFRNQDTLIPHTPTGRTDASGIQCPG